MTMNHNTCVRQSAYYYYCYNYHHAHHYSHHHYYVYIVSVVNPSGCFFRAGFTLRRALFRKMWGRSTGALGWQTLFFLEKKTGDLFCSSLWFHSEIGGRPLFHYFRMQKFAPPFVEAPFCGALFGRTCLNPPLARFDYESFLMN